MPRYYFNFCGAGGVEVDDFGLELPDLASARNEAAAGALSIMCQGVRQSELDLAAYFEIEDSERMHLGRVTFREVLTIRE